MVSCKHFAVVYGLNFADCSSTIVVFYSSFYHSVVAFLVLTPLAVPIMADDLMKNLFLPPLHIDAPESCLILATSVAKCLLQDGMNVVNSQQVLYFWTAFSTHSSSLREAVSDGLSRLL